MERSIINPALSVLMKHLVIGQRQKTPNFSPFHWSPHGSLVSIGQHFVTTREVYLPRRTETTIFINIYCMASQSSPLRRKFMEWSIINSVLSVLMKHLVIGQCQKAHNFSAVHGAPHGSRFH